MHIPTTICYLPQFNEFEFVKAKDTNFTLIFILYMCGFVKKIIINGCSIFFHKIETETKRGNFLE